MDALVGTLIKEDPLNLGLLVGTPGWDPHLPGSRPPGFNGAGFGSSTTGPPYGFDPSTDIRRVANSNGKATYFSSSGLARRLCRCVAVRNEASKALNAALDGGIRHSLGRGPEARSQKAPSCIFCLITKLT